MMKSGLILFSLFVATPVLAAAADNIRLADSIAPAPFGYEQTATRYVVGEATRLYISPYIYPGTVDNQTLQQGQAIEVLAKVKDFDWMLVGRNGIGVGYVPLSRLVPAGRATPTPPPRR